MQSIWKSKGGKLHTRNIEVTTYDYDGQRIIVEGFLKDDRFHESHVITGETFPSGVIHHMAIRLLVNCSNLLIEDVDVDLISVPREVCRETKGCTHLVELLLAMAPAAIQGFAAHQSQKPSNFDPDRANMILQFLVNTCHAWREDGPLVQRFKKKLDMK
jgi:hypothetical protein